MTLRKMELPPGWYPHDRKGVESTVESWNIELSPQSGYPAAGIVPHAGWYFSGKEAWKVISRIPSDTETVIVAGGHLAAGSPILCWDQDSYETPHGNLKMNKNLFKHFCSGAYRDENADNTIEIQMPLISYRLRSVKILAVRLPPDKTAFRWGAEVGRYCLDNNLKAFFLGSTDLTHYGSNYGNLIYRESDDPVEEARRRDRELLEKLSEGNIEGSLESVEKWHTACSAGGALGAAGFASARNKLPGKILSLTGSYDKLEDHSNFVDYGTVIF